MAFGTIHSRYSADEIQDFYATGQWIEETLPQLLERQMLAQPDRVFITDGKKSLTYQELNDRSISLAVGLRKLGISAGDVVSVQIPSWVEFTEILVALSRIGAITLPIMPIYRHDEVGYILGDAGVKLAITTDSYRGFDYLDMYRTLLPNNPQVGGLILVRPDSGTTGSDYTNYEDVFVNTDPESARELIGPGVSADEPFTIVYSSGTTARAKGCLHTFNTMGCGARALAETFGHTSADVQFGPSPVTHTTGLVTSVLIPMVVGGSSLLMAQWDPEEALKQIQEYGCTAAVTATTFIQTLIEVYDPARHDMSTMRAWTAAGSPIPGAVVEKCNELFPKMRVISLYGRTENITTTSCRIDDDPQRSVTSDGKVLPLQEVKIVDEDGNEVPIGSEGDITYKGAMHMIEYINNPVETAKLFTKDGFSRSGDLGYMDKDGYVRVSGRTKDIVIRGGVNISVRQVEDLLTAHEGVRAVAVVAMPDEKLGEKCCCYLIPAEGHDWTLDSVRDYLLGQGLAIQKVPERLEIVQELPMTPTGKIQKHVLRKEITEVLEREKAAATS